MTKFTSITLFLAVVSYACGAEDSKIRTTSVVAWTNVGAHRAALRGLQEDDEEDDSEEDEHDSEAEHDYDGDWDHKEKPEWWDEVASFGDEFETLKVCEMKAGAPEEGSDCAWHDKTCFFDTQQCESVDDYHPKYECTCSGGSDWEHLGEWHCMPVSCPEDDTDEAYERSFPITKPDCDSDDGKGKGKSGTRGKSGSGKSGKKGDDDDDEDYCKAERVKV